MYSLDCPESPNLESGELIILKYIAGNLEFESRSLDYPRKIVKDIVVSTIKYSIQSGLTTAQVPLDYRH